MENFKKNLALALEKAWEDANFKRELISNPVKAIESLTGEKVVLKEGLELVITDQSDVSKVYVNIPRDPDMSNVELSEEQLELVAGGGIIERIKDIVDKLWPPPGVGPFV